MSFKGSSWNPSSLNRRPLENRNLVVFYRVFLDFSCLFDPKISLKESIAKKLIALFAKFNRFE